MDITRGIRSKPGRTRTVHPLADLELIDAKSKFYDPEFSVEVMEESNVATARRWDEHHWDPTNKKDKHYSEKMMKVGSAEVKDLVVSWNNLFDGTTPIECTPDNKPVLVEVVVETLDEEQPWKSLWRLTQIAIDKQKKAEAGN